MKLVSVPTVQTIDQEGKLVSVSFLRVGCERSLWRELWLALLLRATRRAFQHVLILIRTTRLMAVGAVFSGGLFTPLEHFLLSIFLLNELVAPGAIGYLLLLWLLLVFEVALAVASLDEMLKVAYDVLAAFVFFILLLLVGLLWYRAIVLNRAIMDFDLL